MKKNEHIQFNVINVEDNSKLHEFGVLDRQAPERVILGPFSPGNAIAMTPPGSRMSLWGRSGDSRVTPSMIASVFGRFRRLASANAVR